MRWQRSVANTRSTPRRSAASPNARVWYPVVVASTRTVLIGPLAPSPLPGSHESRRSGGSLSKRNITPDLLISCDPTPRISHQSHLLRIVLRSTVPRFVEVRHRRSRPRGSRVERRHGHAGAAVGEHGNLVE